MKIFTNESMAEGSTIDAAGSSAVAHRFKLFHGTQGKDGKIERTRTVGMAYLRDGQSIYTIRLWMFPEARFYLIASQKTLSHYLVMTREPSRNPNSTSKYHWNIVGNGQVETMAGVIRLQFDLLQQPIYMSLFPEEGARPESTLGAAKPSQKEGSFNVA